MKTLWFTQRRQEGNQGAKRCGGTLRDFLLLRAFAWNFHAQSVRGTGEHGNCQRACKPGSVHRASKKRDCAAIPLGDGLPRPSSNQPGRRAGTRLMWRPYSVLHPVGFTVPMLLPAPRCALAAPFRPYRAEARRCPFCGTIPEPCRSGARRALPGTVVPWSPDFPRPAYASRGRPALWRAAI